MPGAPSSVLATIVGYVDPPSFHSKRALQTSGQLEALALQCTLLIVAQGCVGSIKPLALPNASFAANPWRASARSEDWDGS